MKNILKIACLSLLSMACQKVPAGHVGVKVYLLGTEKGVDHEVLGVGRYWIGVNEELYLFPTFKQNFVWTKDATEGSPTDESIDFQTKEGLSVNTDVGITYSIEQDKVSTVFQSYRRGVEEITDIFLRNQVRDAFNKVGSTMPMEAVYGEGKQELLRRVEDKVKEQVGPLGIKLEAVYLVGRLRLPSTVETSINAKLEATQKAQQRENELREAEAAARKAVASAQGEADAILLRAKAQALANQTLARSLTRELIEYERTQKWDGKLPQVSGGIVPMLNLK